MNFVWSEPIVFNEDNRFTIKHKPADVSKISIVRLNNNELIVKYLREVKGVRWAESGHKGELETDVCVARTNDFIDFFDRYINLDRHKVVNVEMNMEAYENIAYKWRDHLYEWENLYIYIKEDAPSGIIKIWKGGN